MLSKGFCISPAYTPSLISSDRPLQVSKLISDQGLSLERINKIEYESFVKLMEYFGRIRFFQERFLDYRDKPFAIPLEKELRDAFILTGYFQSFSFVQENSKAVIPFLTSYLNKISLPNPLNRDTNVIHIRGGDLKNLENFNKYGVLGVNFYESLPIDYSLDTIIVTDDLERAQFIAKRIKVNSIIGPETLNPWQALKLMVDSTNLFAANSTLSLWASFLKLNKKGLAYVPNPIFRDRNFDANGSLSLPGVHQLLSQFQNFDDS